MTEGFVQGGSANVITHYMAHKERVSQYKNVCRLVRENTIQNRLVFHIQGVGVRYSVTS